MKTPIILFLVAVLPSCATNEMKTLQSDLEKSKVTEFAFEVAKEVGGSATFRCDQQTGQEILKKWSKSLKEAGIASWPKPGDHLILSFENNHKYRIQTFIGWGNMQYTVLYTADNIYTGEQLRLEGICPGLEKAHNTSLNLTHGADAPLAG